MSACRFKIRMSIRSFVVDNKGAFAPIIAIMFTVLMGAVAVGVDVGEWLRQKHQLQTAADAGALAGGYALADGMTNNAAQSAADDEADNNGYNPNTANSSINVNITANGDGAGNPSVEVTVTQTANTYFYKLISSKPIYTTTYAKAQVEAPDGVFCMLALGQDASPAITTSGNVTINASGCGLAMNSTASDALQLNGNVTVNVGDVNMAGGFSQSGNGTFTYNTLRTNASQIPDPYSSLDTSNEPSTCTAAQQAAGPVPYFGPGVYCGGISFSGNTTMAPGTYYIDGGSFSLAGQTAVTGTGVTIVLTNSAGSSGSYGTMNVTGGGGITLTAPTSGYYQGVAIYQDRNTPQPCTDNFEGNAAISIDGVFYAPSCEVDYGGTTTVNTPPQCTKIISDSIVFHGTPSIGSNCDATNNGNGSTKAIGIPAVTLIK